MNYRCRFVKPNVSVWHAVTASSIGEAVQRFHGWNVPSLVDNHRSIVYPHRHPDDSLENIYFALIEVEGHGEMVSKIYYSGIWRKGRRVENKLTIDAVAKMLGWKKNPQELLESWEGEDTVEQAINDRINNKGLYEPRAAIMQ